MGQATFSVSPAMPVKCIFCGDANISHTLVWPEWLDAMFPGVQSLSADGIAEMPSCGPPDLGAPLSRRSKLTCENCTNGWIKALGERVQEFVVPALQGERISLTPDQVKALSGLVCVIAVTAAFMTQHCGVSPGDRSYLRHTQLPPKNWSIQVAGLSGTAWSRACKHDPFRIEFAGNPRTTHSKARVIRECNTQLLSIGMGHLFFHVFSSPSLLLLHDFNAMSKEEGLTPLWPPARWFGLLPPRDVKLPPELTLCDDKASQLADRFAGRLQARLPVGRPIDADQLAQHGAQVAAH